MTIYLAYACLSIAFLAAVFLVLLIVPGGFEEIHSHVKSRFKL